MNNSKLLTGVLLVASLSSEACAEGPSRTVITLEQIFESAETNSATLRPSFTAQDEAKHDISVARSERMPDINASLSFSYIGDGFTTKRDLSDYQRASIPHFGNNLSLNISQPIYTGGVITKSIEQAQLRSTVAQHVTDFQRDNIRFRLTGFYLDIYKYTNLRQVTENNIVNAKKVLEEMRAKYEQGTALHNDITRYELLVSDLELQLIKIDNTLEILNRNLVATAGLPDGTVVMPDTTILSRAIPMTNERWWQQEATANAPALRLAKSDVDISRNAESIVRAERLPKINVQAGWTIDGPILVEIPPINRNLSYWYIGIGVSYNLSSLYKSNKTLARSRAATHRAEDELDLARENLELAVNETHVRYIEAYEELKTQQKSVELADRNYHTTSTRYSADMALITDMVDAANAKLEAERQLVNARINILYYYYKLLFTSGKI